MEDVPDLICEDGVNACEGEVTDCCETIQPKCWVDVQLDPDDTVLVVVCRNGMGCQA
jgi:hypothetical protein